MRRDFLSKLRKGFLKKQGKLKRFKNISHKMNDFILEKKK